MVKQDNHADRIRNSKEFIEIIRQLINDDRVTRDDTRICTVQSVNDDGTLNVYFPNDENHAITNVINQCRYDFNPGDDAVLYQIKNRPSDAFIVAKCKAGKFDTPLAKSGLTDAVGALEENAKNAVYTTDVKTLTVDGVTYSIIGSGTINIDGGTKVVANPGGTGDPLETLQVGETVYTVGGSTAGVTSISVSSQQGSPIGVTQDASTGDVTVGLSLSLSSNDIPNLRASKIDYGTIQVPIGTSTSPVTSVYATSVYYKDNGNNVSVKDKLDNKQDKNKNLTTISGYLGHSSFDGLLKIKDGSIELDTTAYGTGSVTSVQVEASGPLESSNPTASSTVYSTTIKFKEANKNTVLCGPTLSGSASGIPSFRNIESYDFAAQSPNKVLIGPENGGNASPTFRELTKTDLPLSSLPASEGDTTTSLVTTGEKYTWNNKSDFSGNYEDLTNKPPVVVANDTSVTSQGVLSALRIGDNYYTVPGGVGGIVTKVIGGNSLSVTPSTGIGDVTVSLNEDINIKSITGTGSNDSVTIKGTPSSYVDYSDSGYYGPNTVVKYNGQYYQTKGVGSGPLPSTESSDEYWDWQGEASSPQGATPYVEGTHYTVGTYVYQPESHGSSTIYKIWSCKGVVHGYNPLFSTYWEEYESPYDLIIAPNNINRPYASGSYNYLTLDVNGNIGASASSNKQDHNSNLDTISGYNSSTSAGYLKWDGSGIVLDAGGGSGSVTKVIGGSNIIVNPAGGTGDVTVSLTDEIGIKEIYSTSSSGDIVFTNGVPSSYVNYSDSSSYKHGDVVLYNGKYYTCTGIVKGEVLPDSSSSNVYYDWIGKGSIFPEGGYQYNEDSSYEENQIVYQGPISGIYYVWRCTGVVYGKTPSNNSRYWDVYVSNKKVILNPDNVIPDSAGTTKYLTINSSGEIGLGDGGSYTLPLAANGTRGGIQIGYTQDDTEKNYPVQLSGEKAYVHVPWTGGGSGTVTSVQVQATSPVLSSQSSAQTSALNTTISLADGYGDTKNPYGTKTANYVLAGPTSGSSSAPSFRALSSDDIPGLNASKITSGTFNSDRIPSLDASKINAGTLQVSVGSHGNRVDTVYAKAILFGADSSTDLATALGAKQNTINSSAPLDADYVNDSNSTNKFVSSSDISNWNNSKISKINDSQGSALSSLTIGGTGYTIPQGTVVGSSLADGYFVVGNTNSNVKQSTMMPKTSAQSWVVDSDVYVPTMKGITNYISGSYQTKIGQNNKIDADYVSDSTSTNKFVTAVSTPQAAITTLSTITIGGTTYNIPQGTVTGSNFNEGNFVLGNGASGISGSTYVPTKSTSSWDATSDAKIPTMKSVTSYVSSSYQTALTFDNSPTQNSNNPVKSGGVYTALEGKQTSSTKLTNIANATGTGFIKIGDSSSASIGSLSSTDIPGLNASKIDAGTLHVSVGKSGSHVSKVYATNIYFGASSTDLATALGGKQAVNTNLTTISGYYADASKDGLLKVVDGTVGLDTTEYQTKYGVQVHNTILAGPANTSSSDDIPTFRNLVPEDFGDYSSIPTNYATVNMVNSGAGYISDEYSQNRIFKQLPILMPVSGSLTEYYLIDFSRVIYNSLTPGVQYYIYNNTYIDSSGNTILTQLNFSGTLDEDNHLWFGIKTKTLS